MCDTNKLSNWLSCYIFNRKNLDVHCVYNIKPGHEITAYQRSMIDRKLLLISREARLPIILIGKNHCFKNVVNVVNEHHAILQHYHRTYNRTYPILIGQIFIWSAENHHCWSPWSGTLETLFRALHKTNLDNMHQGSEGKFTDAKKVH
jgi:hypothetical protein